jgi:hypothetical protein
VEPTEAQFLIINALQTLNLLLYDLYDAALGDWYISTPSSELPIAIILPSGDIVPTQWREV